MKFQLVREVKFKFEFNLFLFSFVFLNNHFEADVYSLTGTPTFKGTKHLNCLQAVQFSDFNVWCIHQIWAPCLFLLAEINPDYNPA